MALEKQLEGPRITGKDDPGPQVPPPPSKVAAGGKQCATRPTITPSKICSVNIYRRIKRRVGRSLRRAKGKRGIPSWNLSLVLHQLTKAPFEPLKEASLKHLTFKTVFLLALGSGKRRSEIHAWLHKNIRHQSDWSKVSLYPSPSFLSKNQLAKEGPDSVAPVVIPALAPSLDKSLKGDRSLCPVRALRYYLDRTSDLRQNKELVFVSFKKGFDKDISPATISSWIKQTVILCYELSDQEALSLHQVKAHDGRAFAASKAFQSGISLDQILSACHWKSHNTFTQFYLKDVAWADSELFHLGPVVAAQQVHHQAQKRGDVVYK